MHGHHTVNTDTSTHSLLLKTQAESILGVVKEFRAICLSFTKFGVKKLQKLGFILLQVDQSTKKNIVDSCLSMMDLVFISFF